MNRIWQILRTNVSLTVIVVAALLLQLTVAIMFFAAQRVAQQTMEQMVDSEMNAIAMSIRKQLARVEAASNNMDWMLQRNLSQPDSLYPILRSFVENNPAILSSGIAFMPNYYPQKGYWFEPYAVRRATNATASPKPNRGNWFEPHEMEGTGYTIETMQLGSEKHDYTRSEFYRYPMEHDDNHWSEPYLEPDGARTVVTTYSTPIHNRQGAVIGVLGVDITLEWLNGLLDKYKRYGAAHRFLLSRDDSLLVGDNGSVARAFIAQLKDNKAKNDTTITDAEGEKLYVFYNPVGGITDWTLVCICSDRVAFSKVRHAHMLLLFLVLASLFFVGFIVYRSSQSQERLNKINAERERIKGELNVASQIQQSMLPGDDFNNGDVDIAGFLVPAREVGGDLFDYYVRDGKLFFCIGDVSGKGAPSALVMSVVHSLFRVFSAHDNNPAHIIAGINESACRGNRNNIFLTFFIGVLDLPTGHLRYCDAGHEAPLILHPSGDVQPLPTRPHLPAGVFEDVAYNVQETHLAPADTIFLYTDGLTEAKNSHRQQFGLQRTTAALALCAQQQLSARETLETIRKQVSTFVAGAEQSDDLTLLAIHYTPRQFDTTLSQSIQLKNSLEHLPRLGEFIKSVSHQLHLDHSLSRQLRLAIEEAVVNIIEYAYPDNNDGHITLRIMSDGRSLKIVITDTGIPFDPTAIQPADTSLPAEDRPIGGLGILLVRQLMDTINYERLDGQNILTLTKNVICGP